MITILLVIAAAIFKSIADTIAHHKDISIFKGIFWGQDGPFFPGTNFRVDGWHLSNSLMIVCFVFAAVFHTSSLKWWIEIILLGGLFILVFNVFYDKVWLK